MNQIAENKEFIYEFEKFVLDPNERILLADGKPVHLTDKVFDTLLLLIQHNGRLVTKDEMMASIWEGSFVEEGNLAKNISRLRKIVNVNGASLIETLPRRGYRFAADVKEIDGDTSVLVRRNLRVKITHTEDDGKNGRKGEEGKIRLIERVGQSQRSRHLLALGAVLSLAVISGLGFYLWKSEKKIPQNEAGVTWLTDDPADDFWPKWTSDGQISFYRMGSDKKGKHMLMNADGTDQTEVEPGFWSPDGTKVLVWKPGDKTAIYLRNADGSNEIALPPMGNTDWSADSKQIVFQRSIGEPRNFELFIYSLETRQTKNITNHPGFDADPSFSPDGRQVVFVSTRDGNSEVYLMNVDGSNVRRLTDHPAFEVHPVFSPDGTQIAFNSDRENENPNVYLMRPDGSDVRRLTDWASNETVEPGCWSPDGTRLAIFSDIHGNDDIFVMSADVYRPKVVLADESSDLQSPSYSPDDKRIVYHAELPDKSGELRVFDTETQRERVLLKTTNTDIMPMISPDGTKVVFQAKIESNTEVCSINIDGTGFVNLTNNQWRDGGAVFSPDGRQIVFSSNRDGNTGKYNLYMMNTDGEGQRLIYSADNGMSGTPAYSPDGTYLLFANDFATDGNFEIFKFRFGSGASAERLTFRGRYDGNPAFSPDGRFVAFVSNTDGNAEIYLMDSDGRNLLRLTRNPAADTTPQFSRDGKRLIFSSNRGGKYALYEIRLSE